MTSIGPQSNKDRAGSSGLASGEKGTNPTPGQLVCSYTVPSKIDLVINGGNNEHIAQINFDPNKDDSNDRTSFLKPLSNAVDVFNYYQLVKVDFTFITNNILVNDAQLSTGGLHILKICPWTAEYLIGSSFPATDISILEGCHTVIVGIKGVDGSLVDQPPDRTGLQRMFHFTIHPQYQQNAGGDGSKLQYARMPLQNSQVQELTKSNVSPSIPLLSQEEDLQQSHSQGYYFAITSWEHLSSQDQVLKVLRTMNPESILVSEIHRKGATRACCQTLQTPIKPHHHWLVKFKERIRISQFPAPMKKACWINTLSPREGDTWKTCLAKWINYIKGKGPLFYQEGTPLIIKETTNKRTKSDDIYDLIRQRTRLSTLISMYPSMNYKIRQLMIFRPPRTHRTDVVYYWGKPGVGKTTAISRILDTIAKCYHNVDYYCKMGGLDKFWDGYDNQPICWIDDPVSASVERHGDESAVQRLKNILSTGAIPCEIKGGSMVLTAH